MSEPLKTVRRNSHRMVSFSGSWSGLPEEFGSQLFGSATLHRLNAGDALFQVGDEGDGCYRLDKGFLKVILTSPEGEERILAILTPGAVVGDLAMIDGLPRSASVAALTDCELRFVCRTAFEQSVSQNPEIYRYLVKVLAARLREADEIIATLAFLSVRGRVVHALLELARTIGVKTGSEIVIPRLINQRDLAAMAGVARENVNRVLSDLQRKKIVSKSSDSYRVEDEARLEQEVVSRASYASKPYKLKFQRCDPQHMRRAD